MSSPKSQPDIQVKVEPPEAALPRPPRKATATKAGIDRALAESAARLAAQQEPPSDVHPKPTTPTKAAVAAAVERSAEHLEGQGVIPSRSPVPAPPAAVPVSAGLANPAMAAAPVSGARDKSMDAAPVFTAPVLEKPRGE